MQSNFLIVIESMNACRPTCTKLKIIKMANLFFKLLLDLVCVKWNYMCSLDNKMDFNTQIKRLYMNAIRITTIEKSNLRRSDQ